MTAETVLIRSDLDWLSTLREASLARFAATGLPTCHDEPWHFTSLKNLESLDLTRGWLTASGTPPAVTVPSLFPDSASHPRLVLVDGRVSKELSRLPDGLRLDSLADVLTHEPDFARAHFVRFAAANDDRPTLAALNTAFVTDGFVLRVDAGVSVAEPIEVLCLYSAGVMVPVRGIVVLGANSRATLVEHHATLAGAGGAVVNVVTDITLGTGAELKHIKIQDQDGADTHIALGTVEVAATARYDNFALTLGSKLSRNEIHVTLAEAKAECHLLGAYLIAGTQHADTTTEIDHAAASCTSREVYKGVVDDKGHAVFQGRILVRPNSQQTDGYQLNRALLLSDEAEVDSKPELEIHADDVKCSHGAAAGALDEESLFYLRARGIDVDTARQLLVAAFVGEVVDEIADPHLRSGIHALVESWLAGHARMKG